MPKRSAAPTKVLVTVIDGDTRKRIPGARGVIGRRADYAGWRGIARIRIRDGAADAAARAPRAASPRARSPLRCARPATARCPRRTWRAARSGARGHRPVEPQLDVLLVGGQGGRPGVAVQVVGAGERALPAARMPVRRVDCTTARACNLVLTAERPSPVLGRLVERLRRACDG